MERDDSIHAIYHNSSKIKIKNIMLACLLTNERANERRNVCTSGKWIFNGNIYIAYLCMKAIRNH